MRPFNFRLAPVQRLKNYQIEQKEQEIAELESQEKTLIVEINEGRRQVEEMRFRLMREESDKNILQLERQMDMFRHYMSRVESQKKGEIRKLREQQAEKRKELVKLYQEEKILDRLREKKEADWNKEMRKEESAQMDEIGNNKYARKRNEWVGALVYLLLPIALIGTAAAAGIYMGYIDKSMLEKIPIIGDRISSSTQTVEVASATEPEEAFTLEEMIGNADTPMPEILQRVADMREQLRAKQLELEEREKQINRRETLMQNREQKLASIAQSVTEEIQTMRQLEAMREERQKSELSDREQQLAAMIEGNKAKDVAPVIAAMFQDDPLAAMAAPGEEIKPTEQQLIVLRIFHRMTDKNRSEMFGELGDENPQTAAKLVEMFYKTDLDELYGITEEPNPGANTGQQQGQPAGQGAGAAQGAGAGTANGAGQAGGANPNPNQPELGAPDMVGGENGNNAPAGE